MKIIDFMNMVRDENRLVLVDGVNANMLSYLFSKYKAMYTFCMMTRDGKPYNDNDLIMSFKVDNSFCIECNFDILPDVSDLEGAVVLKAVYEDNCVLRKFETLPDREKREFMPYTNLFSLYINSNFGFSRVQNILVDLVGREITKDYLIQNLVWQQKNLDCNDYCIPDTIEKLLD